MGAPDHIRASSEGRILKLGIGVYNIIVIADSGKESTCWCKPKILCISLTLAEFFDVLGVDCFPFFA